MPSSTSSSNKKPMFAAKDRVPQSICLWEAVLAVSLFFAALSAIEVFLRLWGLNPSVSDSKQLWSMHRARAAGEQVIVISGASRSLLGIDPSVLKKAFPGWRVVHLGIDGTLPFAVFEDLAFDPAFRGILLGEFSNAGLLPPWQNMAEPWVRYYRNRYQSFANIDYRINQSVQVFLQTRWVVFSPAMNLTSILKVGPYRSYQHMRADRFRPAHYRSRMEPHVLERHRAQRLKRAQELLENAHREATPELMREVVDGPLHAMARSLESRGGKIILVRMPTTGAIWELNESYFPRRDYWDFIQPTTGIPTIHFRDDPVMRMFDCPDLSHLDAEDAPHFTRRLARHIRPYLEARN